MACKQYEVANPSFLDIQPVFSTQYIAIKYQASSKGLKLLVSAKEFYIVYFILTSRSSQLTQESWRTAERVALLSLILRPPWLFFMALSASVMYSRPQPDLWI